MEAINRKNLMTTPNDAINSLNKYIELNDEKYLNEAFELDNTNPKILYFYLKNKKKNPKVFEMCYNKYKFFLNEEFSKKLNLQYIDHKKDVFAILNSVKDINIELLNIEPLKKSLTYYYPREDMQNFELNSKIKINNMPFNLNDEHMFFLSLKVELGEKLYPIIDFEIDENNKNETQITIYKNCLSYVKILTKIIIYFLENNQKELIYTLLSIVNFNDVQSPNTDMRLVYYLNLMKEDLYKAYKETGYNIFKYNAGIPTMFIDNDLKKCEKIFFELIEKILQSNCIKDVLKKIKEIHNDDNFNKIEINKNFIDFFKRNTLFCNFFDKHSYGITNVRELKTLINTDCRNIMLDQKYTLLFNFSVWILTGLHEFVGHLLKDFFYYSSNFIISHESPKIKFIENTQKNKEEMKAIAEKGKVKNESEILGEDKIKESKTLSDEEEEEEEEEEYEEGFQVEKLLFGDLDEIYLCDILYIIDIKNWEKNLDDFAKFFTSEKRKRMIRKKKITYQINEESNRILSFFNISKDELSFIKSNVCIKCKKEKVSQPYIKFSGKCGTHKNYKNLFI